MYLRVDRMTGESEIMPITNLNALSAERHIELFNPNDEEHINIECIENNFGNL